MEENNEIKDLVSQLSKDTKTVSYNIPDELIDEEPFDERYFIEDLNKVELIKYFEGEIRDSFEYKYLIDLFKNALDVKSCVFFKGYSIENGFKLEFHHHPFTLFDYTEAVVNKQADTNDDSDGNYVLENEVEKEVVLLHYKLMVGLVPLNPTAHGLVHDGKLDIHPSLIIGNHEKFYNEYNKYISQSAKDKYEEYMEKYKKDGQCSELIYPENFEYKPTIIRANNKHLLNIDKINKLLIGDKLNNINNEYINAMMENQS